MDTGFPVREEDCECLEISGLAHSSCARQQIHRMTLRNVVPESEITNIHTHGLHTVGALAMGMMFFNKCVWRRELS
jgi:hypothetical protein